MSRAKRVWVFSRTRANVIAKMQICKGRYEKESDKDKDRDISRRHFVNKKKCLPWRIYDSVFSFLIVKIVQLAEKTKFFIFGNKKVSYVISWNTYSRIRNFNVQSFAV